MKDIHLLGGVIVADQCETVLSCAPGPDWETQFRVMGGRWRYEDGCLIGEERGNRGGILFTRKAFADGYLMRCKMRTVLPATRDVNCIFCGHWDEQTDYIGDSYICGLNGWYDHKSGIERNDSGFCKALTGAYTYQPGSEVEMCVGSLGGHTFMVVDDLLIAELIDTQAPLLGGHFGFSPYCTRLAIRDIEIKKIAFRPEEQSYEPEF